MNPGKRITVRDVAVAAGVSHSTVSRALRNHPALPEQTRQRVQEAARRLGYAANPLVSDVMTRVRAATDARFMGDLAYVTNWPRKDEWRNIPLYRRTFEGASERARQLGYRLDEYWLREAGMSARRTSQILDSRGVEGLIIAQMPMRPARRHLSLDWSRFATVAIGHSLWKPALDRALFHQWRLVGTAMRQLRRLGYRRIGFAVPSENDERTDNLMTGAFLVQRQRFGANRLPMLVTPKFSKETFLRWYQKEQPQVVIGIGDEGLCWLRESGKRVPRDVGWVDLNLHTRDGSRAGMDQEPGEIGASAVELLVAKLQRHERGLPSHPRQVLIEGVWVEGVTVRDQRG